MKKQILSLLLLTSLSYAFKFLKDRNDIAINQKQLYSEMPNPLTSEPVFMVLQKDLTDIN